MTLVFNKFIMPLFFIVLSIAFLIGSIMLPDAPLGNPNAPKYFPEVISVLLLFFSVIHFIQSLIKNQEAIEELKQLLKKRTLTLIGFTIVISIIFSLIFERIGFIISMMIFLGALLFVVNGPKKWITNICVAVLFSLISWFIFGYLLEVSLP